MSFLLRCKKVDIGHRVKIIKGSYLSGYNKIHDFSVFGGHLGSYSYVGRNSQRIAKVGNFCSIGPNVRTVIAYHPTSGFVSTHPSTYSTRKQAGISFINRTLVNEFPLLKGENYPVVIGNDVFIGDSVLIVGNVRIGDGAVIAAGSVVVKDVEPFCVVGGNPAKIIKKRFSEEQITRIQNIQWWNKDEEWLKYHCSYMNDVNSFLKKIDS